MHINLFDIIMLSVFSGAIFLGLYRGMVLSLLNIGALILTLLFTIVLIPFAEEIVKEYTNNSLIIQIASIVVSYILSSFASNWLSKWVKEVIQKYTGGLIDRVLGMWIGAISGYIITFFTFLTLAVVSSSSYVGAKNLWQVVHNIDSKEYPNWIKNASLYPVMQSSYQIFDKLFEESFVENSLKNINIPSVKLDKSSSGEIEAHDVKGASIQTKESIIDEVQKVLLEEEVTKK